MICTSCKTDKPREEFYHSKKSDFTCKTCKKAKRKERYQLQKDQERAYHLMRQYGISQELYEQMYAEQKGSCKICLKKFSTLHVDHDHETGKVRGLLCGSCNRGIGLLQDDPEIIQNAITYLNEHARSKGDANILSAS